MGTLPPPNDYVHKDNVVIGECDSHLDPISDLQSPGTFWYHPHKHGASFLQVLNGMAGGFLVEGDFDESLRRQLHRKGGARDHLAHVTLPPLPEWLKDIDPEPLKRRVLAFSMESGPFINGRKYDPHGVDQTVKVGDTEVWEFRDNSPEPHPFHIHVNPFQITRINGRGLPRPWVWFDTMALPVARDSAQGEVPGVLITRHRFLEFIGD